MIILTAGHTGAGTGAQCVTTQFDEGSETIWLRNRVAEILTNKYGLVVLMDDDTASLKLLTKALSEDLSHTECTECTEFDFSLCSKSFINVFSAGAATASSVLSVSSVREKESSVSEKNNSVRDKNNSVSEKNNSVREKESSVRETTFLIDLHFNAHSNPNARGTETIVSDDATELELRMASRLAHATADSLEIPLRGIKSESQTPHRRLAMLHLTPQSIILEVCFCTSPEDVEAYRKHRRKIASTIAKTIAELVTF